MDVKTTFLNGVVEEEVCVEQPLSFETHDREPHVCRLKKAPYGLKQAARTWYGRIDGFLSSLGFTKSKVAFLTFTTRLNMEIQWYSYYMWMICL